MSHKNQRQSCKRFITHLNTVSFLVLYLLRSHSLGCHTTYTKKVWGYAVWINKKKGRNSTRTHAHTKRKKTKYVSGLILTTSLVVFIAERIAYIPFLHRNAHMWSSYISSQSTDYYWGWRKEFNHVLKCCLLATFNSILTHNPSDHTI